MDHPSKGWRYAQCALPYSTSPGPLQRSPWNPMHGTTPPYPPEPGVVWDDVTAGNPPTRMQQPNCCQGNRSGSGVVLSRWTWDQRKEPAHPRRTSNKGANVDGAGGQVPPIAHSRRQSRATYVCQAHINLNPPGEGLCEVVKKKLIKGRHLYM